VCLPDAQPSATIRNISQPFATVRHRPCEFAMAVPLGSAAKVVTFRRFKRRATSFRVAGVALCDIPQHVSYCVKNRSV